MKVHKHMETSDILAITDAFLDQKRVNVCEHAVKWRHVRQEGWGAGGKIRRRLSEVSTRAVSRGQDKLVGKFKMVACDVISIRG